MLLLHRKSLLLSNIFRICELKLLTERLGLATEELNLFTEWLEGITETLVPTTLIK